MASALFIGIGIAAASSDPSETTGADHTLFLSIRQEYLQKNYQKAYQDLLPYYKRHSTDWEAAIMKALLEKKLGQPAKSLKTIKTALRHHPLDYDLLRLGAEDLIVLGQKHEARTILSSLAIRNPNDPIVQADLLKAGLPAGVALFDPFFDQHTYFLTGPPPPAAFDSVALTGFNRWSMTSRLYGLFYTGGSSFAWDTQGTTPLYGDTVRFLLGRTEYFGGSSLLGAGVENFTYAGVDINTGSAFHALLEAGDTQLRPSPGLYGHLSSQRGWLSLDLQGYDNMIWGDFGESIIQNGTETGAILTTTVTVFPWLWATLQNTYLEYYLNGGIDPWGILHNTMVMLDAKVLKTPSVDFFLGYDSWTALTDNPVSAASIPMVPIQDFAFGGILAQKTFRKFSLQAQAGSFYDDHNLFWGYDLGMGVGYHPIPHIDILGNVSYFNLATVVQGPIEQFSSSVRISF